MKMTIHVCDLCRKNRPSTKIRYKAKSQYITGYDSGWKRIELCEDCLNKIIAVDMDRGRNAD